MTDHNIWDDVSRLLGLVAVALAVSIILILMLAQIDPGKSKPMVPTTTTEPWGTTGERIDP